MQPKVSVCIPVYNVAEFLASCLKSVMNQTMKEIEIICVEDGSSDSSGKILKEYAEKDSRIRIIWHEENAGLVKTRKDAVLSARGKYIMFLDSDDELCPNACETAFEAIEKYQTDAVQFGVQSIDYQGNFRETSKSLLTKSIERLEDDNWLYLFDKGQIRGWTIWNKIYKTAICKKAYEQMEDDYIVMAEDVYYFFVFGFFASSFSMITDVLHKYRQGFGIWSGIQSNITLEKYRILLSEKKSLDAIIRFYTKKQNAGKFEIIIQKRVKDFFLQQSVLWWYDKLTNNDKAEGLRIFSETWGDDHLTFAMMYLSETLSKRIRNLDNVKQQLQKAKQQLQEDKLKLYNNEKRLQEDELKLKKENKRLKKELSTIKQSRGYKVIKKYYHVKDVFLNAVGLRSNSSNSGQ